MNRPQFNASLVFLLLMGVPLASYAQDPSTANTDKATVKATASAEPAKNVTVKVEASKTTETKSFAEKPEDSPVDNALMRALEEEYEGDQNVRDPRFSRRRLTQNDVIIVDEAPEPEWTNLRISVSYWFAEIDEESEVTSRTADASSTFELGQNVADFGENEDNEGTLVYEIEIGLHSVISLVGLYYNAEFDRTQNLTGQNIVYQNRGFAMGDNIKTELSVIAGEGAFAIHAIKTNWLKFDVYFGVRYMKTTLEVGRSTDTAPARQRYEMVSPMIGIGFVLRP
ncbi:MAG: hypothetical protein HOI66_16935, partial [Verrucomicrobia bacterium]|nr:hypothetical protein [Verrucomicrobiota bacterium]